MCSARCCTATPRPISRHRPGRRETTVQRGETTEELMSVKMIASIVAVGAACLFSAAATHAQDGAYPTKQIELVVPFPAGGATDVIARMVARLVTEKWGQPIIIQNKAGATGAIGAEY